MKTERNPHLELLSWIERVDVRWVISVVFWRGMGRRDSGSAIPLLHAHHLGRVVHLVCSSGD